MSIDLYLFPLDHLHTDAAGNPWGFSHTILNVPRSDAMQELSVIKAEPLPVGHSIMGFLGGINEDGAHKGESVYGKFVRNPYGTPYTWAAAGDVGAVLQGRHPTHPTTAYVMALPPTTMIVLGWH